ncbi:hypothetical protein CWI36_2535p0010 [Hamiltosporidium magnivora]|uniref:Uncharacterized protein n=1 Tax=Hamiltosporidium magnivora TaxID=148818 RepID=A0A4Q9KTE5_9MICR|nr:hypothetical protein CWI36_2535p0010 [Hamiltosporidium magnivora]
MRKNKMTVIEVVITYQDSLQTVESKKIRKYDLLANELCLIYKFGAEIIHYVMTWDDIRVSVTVILRAEMHKQPSLSLKQVYNQEDGVKTENTKNILSLILDGITSAEVPKINANEHSEATKGYYWTQVKIKNVRKIRDYIKSIDLQIAVSTNNTEIILESCIDLQNIKIAHLFRMFLHLNLNAQQYVALWFR